MKLPIGFTAVAATIAVATNSNCWAAAAVNDDNAKKVVTMTTSDMLRLSVATERAIAHFREARRSDSRRSNESKSGTNAAVAIEGDLRLLAGSAKDYSCKDNLDECSSRRLNITLGEPWRCSPAGGRQAEAEQACDTLG